MMTKQQILSKSMTALVGSLVLSQLWACQTFGFKKAGDGHDAAPKSVVVVQAGRANPAVSSQPRRYWLGLRQSRSLLPRAQGALASGEAAAAVDLARSHLEKHPGDLNAMGLLASALAATRKYELADYYASLIERQAPEDARALNIRGVALLMRPRNNVADYHAAMEYFQRAFQANGQELAAGLNLGSLQLELGSSAAAEATFATVVKRCSDCSAGLMGYGMAAARNKNFGKAKEAFAAVLTDNPNHAAAHYHLALVEKNGYNDKKQAEKHLFAIINAGAKMPDIELKERAHTVLRMMKGEREGREAIADNKAVNAKDLDGGAEDREFDLLLSGAEKGE